MFLLGDSAGEGCVKNKKKGPVILPNPLISFGVPTGSRTPVTGVKGPPHRPLLIC